MPVCRRISFCDCVHSWAWRNINREIEFRVELSYNHCDVDLGRVCALRIGASDRPLTTSRSSMFSRPPASAGTYGYRLRISSTNPKKFGGKDRREHSMGFMRLHGYPPKTVTKIRFSGLSPYAVPLRCSCLRCSLRAMLPSAPRGLTFAAGQSRHLGVWKPL